MAGSVFGLILIINIMQSPFFNSKAYYNRINITEDAEFVDDVGQVDFNALPLLDKASSQKLGDRVMGQMPELVSQFDVSNLYTQINFNNSIVRVTPLEYNGMIKYFTNRKDGIKGYITVNSVTGESDLVKLEQGMKYMPSAYFFENLYRKLRISYPTTIFGSECFETDDDGNPYWVIPTIKYSGVGLREEITGVVILNPITGESTKYDVKDVPTWVDHVYSAELIIEQVNDWGLYKNGYLNSIFGQKNVVQTTTGYNYTVMNDDVYLYTGITSALADEANIGFILTNLRTKETKFYSVPGAEEYSAMASAEGQVQQMNYAATFPLLINLNNKPTYLMSLKDNAGLVKMYALVDVSDYQKVVVTEVSEGIQKAVENYLGDSKLEVDNDKLLNKQIVVDKITSANIDGNTYYYILDKKDNKYKVSIKVAQDILPFLIPGDQVKIYYSQEKELVDILSIEREI
ncbi:MAG: CvpA family protein [Firmicutes bacterium]|nr:CvpA family protein [Bacillota bacterium]